MKRENLFMDMQSDMSKGAKQTNWNDFAFFPPSNMEEQVGYKITLYNSGKKISLLPDKRSERKHYTHFTN